MEYVRFGKTGMKVSRLCLGCMTYGSTKWRDWVLDEEASRPFIREALERGINFFDTADVYSHGASEEILGRAMKEFARRAEVVIATKVFNPMGPGPNAGGLSRKHIMEAIDASLKRLGTDYVDLYQIHRFDPAHADRGDARGAERRRARRQGALCRRVVDVGLAIRAHARDRAASGRRRVRLDAELLQPRLPRGGARDDAVLRRSRASRSFPGRRWRAAISRGSGLGEGASTVRGRTDAYSTRSASGRGRTKRSGGGSARPPTNSASSRRSSRSPGCCRSRTSPRRSSAPPSRIISTTRSPRCR